MLIVKLPTGQLSWTLTLPTKNRLALTAKVTFKLGCDFLLYVDVELTPAPKDKLHLAVAGLTDHLDFAMEQQNQELLDILIELVGFETIYYLNAFSSDCFVVGTFKKDDLIPEEELVSIFVLL